MILLLCGLVALMVAGVCIALVADVAGLSREFFGGIGAIACTSSLIGLFLYCFLIYGYVSAEYKANIMNREYGTKYTQEEVFYASDVIETVRELDRKRIEINGDILKK